MKIFTFLLSALLLTVHAETLPTTGPVSGICSQTVVLSEVDDTKQTTFYGYENVSKERKAIVREAVSHVGEYTYDFGSKPIDWEVVDNKIDCSGFTQLVYYNVTGKDIGGGTFNQSFDLIYNNKGQYIEENELKPGDLGFIYNGIDTVVPNSKGKLETRDNHVGIYVGKDTNGNKLWCHCNSQDGTVVVNTVDYFTVFVKVK